MASAKKTTTAAQKEAAAVAGKAVAAVVAQKAAPAAGADAAATIDYVDKILTPSQLRALRVAWAKKTAQATFKTNMGKLLPDLYAQSKPVLEAVRTIFYANLPPDNAPPTDGTRRQPSPPRDMLSEQDRERCIIALLAGRAINSNIGLHMYIALMLGVSPAEIAHILLLAGIYSGIPAFTDSIQMEVRLLQFLADRVGDKGAKAPVKPIGPDELFDDLRKALGA